MTFATSEYLELRISQWKGAANMDSLMRAADSLDLLDENEHQAWMVDSDRAAALVTAIQAEIDTQKADPFYGCHLLEARYFDPAAQALMLEVLEGK